MGQMIEFARPDGARAPGYYAEGSGTNLPGVVMLEEWWGVTDQVKSTADELASAGFRVLVPDLFRGRTAAVGDEANHLVEGLDFGDAATQDTRGAALYLKGTGSKKVGVMGFCMGGSLALLSAMFDPEFDAAVSFYGYPPSEAGDIGQINIPLQAHWALHDTFFTTKGVRRIEERFKEAKAPYEFYNYDAQHGFLNPNPLGQAGLGHYHEKSARLAWQRTLDFLKKNLQ